MSHQKEKAYRKKRMSFKIFQQFCETTTIHGLKHIYEDGNLLFERYFMENLYNLAIPK